MRACVFCKLRQLRNGSVVAVCSTYMHGACVCIHKLMARGSRTRPLIRATLCVDVRLPNNMNAEKTHGTAYRTYPRDGVPHKCPCVLSEVGTL